MKNWFWPGFVTIVTLTSLSLWFGTNKIERDIALQLEKITQTYSWLQYNIDGRDVVLHGQAVDEDAEKQLVALVNAMPQIHTVDNRLALLPLASPYRFQIEILTDEIILSGAIPAAKLRDQFIELAENNSSGSFIDDQMALARGAPEAFTEAVSQIMPLISLLKSGKIIISDQKINIDGDARDAQAYQQLTEALDKNLAGSFSYGGNFIAQPRDD